MAMDFYAKNTLFPRVNDYVGKVMLRAEKQTILDEEIETLKNALVSFEKLRGSLLYNEEQVKQTVLELAKKQEERKAVSALEEVKFAYDSEQDKKLRKAWKSATTSAMRISALADWFTGYGITGVWDKNGKVDSRLIELEQDLHHKRRNNLKKVVLDGEKMAVDANVSFPVLYSIMADWGFELSLMKADIIPEVLKDTWQKHRDEAKAKREAKKAAKKAKAEKKAA